MKIEIERVGQRHPRRRLQAQHQGRQPEQDQDAAQKDHPAFKKVREPAEKRDYEDQP
jgi:hypothetical protein